MNGSARTLALFLAMAFAVFGPARADSLGPHWSSDQLRAARDLKPVEALRFHLHRLHVDKAGEKASDLEVVLAPSFTLIKESGRSTLLDHALCRQLTWLGAGGGLSSMNCHAMPFFFTAEMQNRVYLNKITEKLGKLAPLYAAEAELHVTFNPSDRLTRVASGDGADYTLSGDRKVRVFGPATVLSPDEVHRVVRFLALNTLVHPQVRRDIGASKRLPTSIEMTGVGFTGDERETLTVSDVSRAVTDYPLPPGLSPEVIGPGPNGDQAMEEGVRAAVAVIRDPAARPKPSWDQLMQHIGPGDGQRRPKRVILTFFAFTQLYGAVLNTPEGMARFAPAVAEVRAAIKDPKAAPVWEAGRLAGDRKAEGDRQAAARALLDFDAEGDDLVDIRDLTLANLLTVSKTDGWDPALIARLPKSAEDGFWRSIAAAPWTANPYHDVAEVYLGGYEVDKAWLAYDLGRAVDPDWSKGIMGSVAKLEARLEADFPDFF